MIGEDYVMTNGGLWIYQGFKSKENHTKNTVEIKSPSLPLDHNNLALF